MLVTTVIPTIGRPTLDRAVQSVLDQTLAAGEHEVVVVNDSGQPLSDAAWQHCDMVRIISTQRHNRSVARNAGAAVAKGHLLHFLDDDDWLLPGALEALCNTADKSRAAWLYGGFRLVDNAGQLIAEVSPTEIGNCFVQLLASEWIPLQASCITAEAFFAVGGFASLRSLLGGYEDIDLARQIVAVGDMARTSAIVAIIRVGDQGSTTNYANMLAQNRQSREKALDLPGAFRRLIASARLTMDDKGYWHGKIVYYYLASCRWNFKLRRILTAGSRAAHAALGLASGGRYLLSPGFWQGLRTAHHYRVRLALEQAGAKLYTSTRWEG